MPKIVGCFTCSTHDELISEIEYANTQEIIDVLEIRLDGLEPINCNEKLIQEIRNSSKKKLILTIRDEREGGVNNFSPNLRKKLFKFALRSNFDFIDIELLNLEIFQEVFSESETNTSFIISLHQDLPEKQIDIDHILEKMAIKPTHIKKLVFSCNTPKSAANLEIFQLNTWTKFPKESLTIFGLGEYSLLSRMQGYFMKNHLTYIGLRESKETAVGQPTIKQFINEKAIMQSMKIGSSFSVQGFGKSHGYQIGCIVNGIPPGKEINLQHIQQLLDARRPGHHFLSSPRSEKDEFLITNGIQGGVTTGNPLRMIIRNLDTLSKDYSLFEKIPRPSHIDYPARLRFGNDIDLAGSGVFSGRLTAPFVMAGAIALQILRDNNILVVAFISQIGTIKDEKEYLLEQITKHIHEGFLKTPNLQCAKEMEAEIRKVKLEKDSIGGKISVIVEGFPPGIGNPWFNSFESQIAKTIMGIPGVRGIEFGSGFHAVQMIGSDHNDPFILQGNHISTSSNNCGGIIGGISLGTPIKFQIAVKPTASIGKSQQSLNFQTKKMEEFQIPGRHDPCIVPRIVPVVESLTAIVLLDELFKRMHI
ncbi:MAG: chorismate synthase [Promethearchaeota archaeon]